MVRLVLYCLLCVCTVQAAPKKKNRVTVKAKPPLTVVERKKTLNEFQEFLAKPSYQLQDILLFAYTLKEAVPEEIKPVEVQKVVELENNDFIVLRAVGKAVRPDGCLAVNGRFVLCLRGSRILKEEDVLYANYKGKSYTITLKAITKNQFTLKLNETELDFQY